ncbi:tetratricopeptide repeat protein [Aliarcobacter butzleri]|uniref:tetratricopeptide repeat protein n=1 Tax=Aliarcobacter butzleri TaxID=28197 RepID=UPI00263F4982|nr:tetratricopeptide repeat protein [Aliarcobacter butzleri]MDN5103742.1 tetratricopeptide repeat protein [Aliarcobacter butzleri]
MKHDLPQSLIDAIKNNTLIPFVGAGISMGIKDNKDNLIFKSWTNSLLDAVEILNYEQKTKEATAIKALLDLPDVDYLETASKIHKYLNSNWNKYLTQTFDKSSENINQSSLQIPKEILKINNLVITTNYDNVLKWACENKDDLIEWDKKALYGQVESLKQNPSKQSIWYLHGKISNPDDIVFTKESYEETYKEDSPVIKIFQTHLLTKSFIFCGFSLDDPYIKMQMEKLKSIFGTNLSKHYMIIQKGQQKDFSYLGDIQFLEVEDYDKDYLALLKKINQQKNSNPILPIQYSQQTIPKSKKFFNVPFESKQNDVVGIEGKLEDIHEKLSNSKKLSIGQVAKFEGMGGLGKTQLAVEYVHKYKDTYPNGVLWLTMDQDIDEQLITLGKTHNLVNQNLDIKEQLDGIKYQLKSFENMLLIYDNTNEQKDIEQEFLPKSSTNKILITTRNPIQGYTLIELETLDFENSKKLLEIESGKTVIKSEIKFVEEICEKLEGLPLALEMAGAYIKYLELSWEKYLNLYNKKNIELLNESKLPESFTKHENNIVNTLTISQKIIDDEPKLKEIINLLSYGANEPIDDKLICKLLACDEIDIIKAIQIGKKLKYIKESSQGYTIHRLLKEVWRIEEKLEQPFIDSVAINLANYIYEIKDEFLNLSKIEIANLFSQQWINYLQNSDTKAILIAYRAYLYYYKGNFDRALEIVKEADEIVEKKDSKEYAEILTYQGSLNQELGNYKASKKFYEQSFEMMKRLYPNQDHPDIASFLNNLGTIQNKKEFDKALDFHLQAFNMRKRLYPNQDHKHIAISLNNLGTVWNDIYDFDKAIDFYTQAFEMRKKLYSSQDHPDIANSLQNLGTIWSNKKDFNKALDFYEKAFEMRKRLHSNHNHPEIIKSMFSLTRILCLNPIKRKEGIKILKLYKKTVTKQEEKQEIENLLKKYEVNIGRDKSKRKKR